MLATAGPLWCPERQPGVWIGGQLELFVAHGGDVLAKKLVRASSVLALNATSLGDAKHAALLIPVQRQVHYKQRIGIK